MYNPQDDSHTQKNRLFPTETHEVFISSINSLKVLVVDENKDNQVLLTVIFEEYEAKIKIATSMDEAIKIMEKWQPDVLISDTCMKEKDGYSLIRSIREKDKLEGTFLPAVVLTAYPEERVEALEAGFQDVILKPFEHDELVAQVVKLSSTRIYKSSINLNLKIHQI